MYWSILILINHWLQFVRSDIPGCGAINCGCLTRRQMSKEKKQPYSPRSSVRDASFWPPPPQTPPTWWDVDWLDPVQCSSAGNHGCCGFLSGVLSCPEDTSSLWSSLASGSYNLSSSFHFGRILKVQGRGGCVVLWCQCPLCGWRSLRLTRVGSCDV